MKHIKILLFPIFIILILISSLIYCKFKINNLNSKVDGLYYKVEIESVLKEKYYTIFKYQIMHQNEQINGDITIVDKENTLEYKLSNIVANDDLVLCIPENSCSDCIDKTIKILENDKNYNYHRIIVLSVFFDKDEQKRFLKTYDISNKKWFVYHIDSKYFWNISNNKIMLFKVNRENKFQNFIILDGVFDELLVTFLKFGI